MASASRAAAHASKRMKRTMPPRIAMHPVIVIAALARARAGFLTARCAVIRSTPRCAASPMVGEHMSRELPAHTRPERSFQGLILELQRYWADHGCVILQPYDMEVGAGTFHPATTLRALGPKPWHAAYVQPSRRPKDGRYGENPNRLQHYYQFQVILKPSPANIQALYLESLVRLGIDPQLHDIRFVEDDWESPTLGAW